MKNWVSKYLSDYIRVLNDIPVGEVSDLILDFKQFLGLQSNIFVIGNGGSAANASHFVTDLGKGASDAVGKRFRCLSLNDNTPWFTAIANDYSYEDVFTEQLRNYAKPDDVLIAISVSGNSPNLVKAIKWAKTNGIKSIVLAGARRGLITELADKSIILDSTHYGHVEDAQMTILHMLCYAFIERIELSNI
jgi:D-sedoheptulose 7-phosphate isomerase